MVIEVILVLGIGIITAVVAVMMGGIVYHLPRYMENQWRQISSGIAPESLPRLTPQHVWRWAVDRHFSNALPRRLALIALMLLLSLALYAEYGATFSFVYSILLSGVLVMLAQIDWEHHLLPDVLVIPTIWLGLLVNLHTGKIALSHAVMGAVIGYVFFWLIANLFYYCTGKEGLGQGDFKLLALLGAWFGVFNLPFIILLSALLGLWVALIMRLSGRLQAGHALAFGPYLAISGVLIVLNKVPVV